MIFLLLLRHSKSPTPISANNGVGVITIIIIIIVINIDIGLSRLCHHMSSEMSLECSRVFVKRSVVNVKWYDSVKVQNYKQELNRSDLCRLTGVF